MLFAPLVDILKEFVTWTVLTFLNDLCQPAIVNVDDMFHPAFAFKSKGPVRAIDAHVTVAHSGQAIGMILARILGVADPDACGLHQTHDGCEHIALREAALRDVSFDTFADSRQHDPERQHPFVFGCIAHLTPPWVIAALLAPAVTGAFGAAPFFKVLCMVNGG